MITKLKSIKPGIFFLVVSLISGIVILIITPPFQVPDEINHFYRSYQIADGNFFSEKTDRRLGGNIPESLVEITKPFLELRGNMNSKTNFKTIRKQFSVPLNDNEKIFVDFPNTALYPPVSYIPQSFSIFILKNLLLPPMVIFYCTRIFTLVIWILGMWLAIGITPVHKWLFLLLGLLPMSVFTNMSLSADVVTNIFAFLFVAYLLKVVSEKKLFSLKNYLLIIFLAIMLASAKIIYTPIILLFCIIPVKKFKNFKRYSLHSAWLLIIGFGVAIFWSESINYFYIPYIEYNPEYRDYIDLVKCANIQDQLDYILHHGFYIVNVFINSMQYSFDMYYQGYIGTFGWLDTKLPMWVIHFTYIVILFTAIFEDNKKVIFNIIRKIVILCSLLATTILVLLSQHLTWDCVGGEIIATIQGRYFIPVFPLLFMLFGNSWIKRQFLTRIVVMIFSVLILLFSIDTLYCRYYVPSIFDKLEIQCDAEETTHDKYFKTSVPDIFLENGNTQSNEYSRSGNYSARLFPEQPYGFTCRFYDGKMGDIINIEVWRLGKSGDIVLNGESARAFYFTSSNVLETDDKGWQKLHLSYTLQRNMKGREIGIFMWNHSNDTSYFDDFSVSVHKRKSTLFLCH